MGIEERCRIVAHVLRMKVTIASHIATDVPSRRFCSSFCKAKKDDVSTRSAISEKKDAILTKSLRSVLYSVFTSITLRTSL